MQQSDNPNFSGSGTPGAGTPGASGSGASRAESGPDPTARGPYQRGPADSSPADSSPAGSGSGSSDPAGPDDQVPSDQVLGDDGADTVDQVIEADQQDQVSDLERRLAERTLDLQRLQAEYVNYKKRVDRDRDVARRAGSERILADLMPVLDNIRRAGEHEEMSDGFKLVAGEIDKLAAQHGLVTFGEAGDVFDPQIHDALMQTQAEGVTEPIAAQIFEVGYRVGDRVLRPARVAVAQPSDDAGEVSSDQES